MVKCLHFVAVCQYQGKQGFKFFSEEFTVSNWHEVEDTAKKIVEEAWAKISPHPAPDVVEILPGFLGQYKE